MEGEGGVVGGVGSKCFKSKSGDLHVIPSMVIKPQEQVVKYSNNYRNISLVKFHNHYIARGITLEKNQHFFEGQSGNLLIIPNKHTKLQGLIQTPEIIRFFEKLIWYYSHHPQSTYQVSIPKLKCFSRYLADKISLSLYYRGHMNFRRTHK